MKLRTWLGIAGGGALLALLALIGGKGWMHAQEGREGWIARQVALHQDRGQAPPPGAVISDLGGIFFRLPTDGWIRLGDGTTAYVVAHSRHWEEPRRRLPILERIGWRLRRLRRPIGDVTLLFTATGAVYVHDCHVCGGPILGDGMSPVPNLPGLLSLTYTDGGKVLGWYPLPPR